MEKPLSLYCIIIIIIYFCVYHDYFLFCLGFSVPAKSTEKVKYAYGKWKQPGPKWPLVRVVPAHNN